MLWALGITFQIMMLIGLVILWRKTNRPMAEDPRMQKGLQILSSKIAVLEDLSDRTDLQVRQLTSLLDRKGMDVQGRIEQAQQMLAKIEESMRRSLEVASIFEDRIPHQEIIERKNTLEYVKAARLAHQGLDIEEIARRVPIPREELELLVKMNREQLMFSEEALPEWIRAELENESPEPQFAPIGKVQQQFASPIMQMPASMAMTEDSPLIEWPSQSANRELERQFEQLHAAVARQTAALNPVQAPAKSANAGATEASLSQSETSPPLAAPQAVSESDFESSRVIHNVKPSVQTEQSKAMAATPVKAKPIIPKLEKEIRKVEFRRLKVDL